MAAALMAVACTGSGRDSFGDGAGAARAAFATKSLDIGGATRSYRLYVPEGLAGPAPLVVALHGGGGNPGTMIQRTGFVKLADEKGFVVAFPQGTGRAGGRYTWNAGGCCAFAMATRADDVGFILALIDGAVAGGLVDPKRVFLTGMSNGGMVSHRIAAAAPEKIAAIGVVVGAMFGGEAPPAAPVSALLINGLKDPVVPYAGGASTVDLVARSQSRPFQPAAYAARYWAKADGCGEGVESAPAQGVTLVRYDQCQDGTVVHFYTLENGEHVWPGANGRIASDAPLNAADLIWTFFEQHDR